MKKLEFLALLQEELSGLPRDEVQEQLAFYSEMIDDRMEEGLTEEEAVARMGDAGQIASQILRELPFPKPKKRFSGWNILLLVLGFPLWFPLLIAAFSVVLSLSVSLWSVVISLWSVFASVAVCTPAGILTGILLIIRGYLSSGIAMIAAGLVCAGVAIFLFFGCKAVTAGILWLTKKIYLGIKHCFIKKEAQ